MRDDVIIIGRLPNISETVPENIVTIVPVRNDMDTNSPSSDGSVSKWNSCLMYLIPPAETYLSNDNTQIDNKRDVLRNTHLQWLNYPIQTTDSQV